MRTAVPSSRAGGLMGASSLPRTGLGVSAMSSPTFSTVTSSTQKYPGAHVPNDGPRTLCFSLISAT